MIVDPEHPRCPKVFQLSVAHNAMWHGSNKQLALALEAVAKAVSQSGVEEDYSFINEVGQRIMFTHGQER